ncbi:MAG: LamB/YcsF family protein [Nitrospirae bacterium]|nr:LamB/YcsF family protein [Candidatus Manganitrophaceae bacterium]
MNQTIDLNADIGERPEALADGSEERIIRLISSGNIACGGHAGDESTMEEVLRLCIKQGVAIGAHPGYPDRLHFGRERLPLSSEEIQAAIHHQLSVLGKKARALGATITQVKPHGALYNAAATDRALAVAIAFGVARWSRDLLLVGLAGSEMLNVWEEIGFRTAAEAFADRLYESDGTLRSRSKLSDRAKDTERSLITDPMRAAEQAARIVREHRVISADGIAVPIEATTLCVHADTPNAPEILSAIRQRLTEEGILIQPLT